MRRAGGVALIVVGLAATPACAQQIDLSHGGPIDISAREGIEWQQAQQEVIARGDARAIRGNVTVTADRLTAWYRKKKAPEGSKPAAPATAAPAGSGPASGQSAAGTPAAGLAGDPSTEGNEIYRLQAEGNVHIFTPTDQAQGDRATYDMDQSVMVMTGRDLKLTTPNDVITARDDLEYWPQKRMAVARGNAVVLTKDAKRIAADTLVAYTAANSSATPGGGQAKAGVTPVAAKPGDNAGSDPMAASGKLERVEAFGHVSIRTPTDTVTGERGVYVIDTGMARLIGNVHITRGQNELAGAEADVNMKTGIATLGAPNRGRVHGLVLPNDTGTRAMANTPDPRSGAAQVPSQPPAAAQGAGRNSSGSSVDTPARAP